MYRQAIGYFVTWVLVFATVSLCFGQTGASSVSDNIQRDTTIKRTEVAVHPVGKHLSGFLETLGEEDPLRIYLHASEGWLLLDFWASWCRPCLRHQTEMKREKEIFFDARGVTIVSVSVHESPQMSRRSHTDRKLPWETFPDISGQFTRALKATSIPQYVLVNQAGVIHGVYTNVAAVKTELKTRINAQSPRVR